MRTPSVMMILCLSVALFCCERSVAQLEPLAYHRPGLEVDLGVGLWAWPLPMDYDHDGDWDLVVNCPDRPSNGIYFFENTTGDTSTDPMPVFLPGVRIGDGQQNVQVSYVDGEPRILTPGNQYPEFRSSALAAPRPLGLPARVHAGNVRANMWRWVDYDGDGALDLVAGVGYWGDYGWDDAYDAKGHWTNGPLRGWVYLARNAGTTAEPQWEPFRQVSAAGQVVEVYGWPSPNFTDFDRDGDLDLLCGEFLDGFTYFQNQGTRTRPRYAAGVRLQTLTGAPLKMDLQMITPTAFDWDRDGFPDLIVGDEDGRVAWIRHAGQFDPAGVPVWERPKYFRQTADRLKFGALATPWACDWDGDGDQDLISGNTAGYLGLFENLGGTGAQTQWAAPRRLKADDRTIRIQAGANGSIQGPAEAKWGYTTLSVVDWNGDQLPDLLVNSILGKVTWYQNLGPRHAPKLAAAQPVRVQWEGPAPVLPFGWMRPQGNELLTQWRTTPVGVDWDGDRLPDLVMLDHQGYLTLYRRRIGPDGQRELLPPARVFLDQQGRALRLSTGSAGKSGRRKLCVVDWDGDGALDLLLNSDNATWLKQTHHDESGWYFADQGLLAERKISSHTTSPTVIDLNRNGVPDLLIGAEDGRFYYQQR